MEAQCTEAQDPIQDHVETIATHEQEFLARRTQLERFGDAVGAFAGSLTFVGIHLGFFAAWLVVNTMHVGRLRHFDPFPFSLLGTSVAMEGIVLSSFILMRQTRMGRRSDERDHLILQILLLSEREITATLRIQREIAARIGLHALAEDKDTEALTQHTSIDEMARTIKQSLMVE